MEKTLEADSGYPEQQPAEVAQGPDAGPDGPSSVRESARDKKSADRAPSNDDGTATGNPHNAGASSER